jgi:hypothetical protein
VGKINENPESVVEAVSAIKSDLQLEKFRKIYPE